MNELVSVIIPNRGSIDSRTTASLKAQTYQNIEIIQVNIGAERSSQTNEGEKMAKGEYIYRIDDDFEIGPTVIEEAVRKCQNGCDAILIHNTSDPSVSLWAKVIKLERDCYRDDPETSFARFVKRSAFQAVGGYDERYYAEEDRDFSERLSKAGFKFGRIQAQEIHLGEPRHLFEIVRKYRYYGNSFKAYLSQHGFEPMMRLGPLREAYVRHWRDFFKDPRLLFPFVIYQFVRYSSALAGMLVESKPFPRLVPDGRVYSYAAVVATRKLEDVKFKLPCPTIIMAGPTMSLNEARNRGAAMLSTDLIAFVDDDNILAPDALDEMAKTFTLDKKIGIVAPLTFDRDGNVWWAGGRFHWTGLYLIEKRIPKGLRITQGFHNVFMARRESFERAGGFDTKRFEFYLAEGDLAERMKALGYYFVVNPKAKVWHDVSAKFSIKNLARSSHIRGTRRAYLVGRNRLLFLRMHKGPRTLIICALFLLPFLTLFHIVGIIGIRKFELIKPYLRGVIDGLDNKS